jgi:hypothetical protein
MRLLIALIAFVLVAADVSAGPILRRMHDRRSSASSCGSGSAMSATSSCGGVVAAATACSPDAAPASGHGFVRVPDGVTVFTDTQGNLWTMVKRSPVLPLPPAPKK